MKLLAFIFGKNASSYEKFLVVLASLLLPLFLLFIYMTNPLGWSTWKIILALLIAFDLSGGLIANSLTSTKHFYYDSSNNNIFVKNKLLFVSLHIYPIIVWSIYGLDYITGLIWYGLLIISAIIVIKMNNSLKKPTAIFIVMISIILNIYIFSSPIGFEWLIPILFLKLISGHLVYEK